jgi:hypothetical protein
VLAVLLEEDLKVDMPQALKVDHLHSVQYLLLEVEDLPITQQVDLVDLVVEDHLD